MVLENKAYGLPVIHWRQDRGVVEVPAEQLERFARRILEVDGDPLPEAEEQARLAHLKVWGGAQADFPGHITATRPGGWLSSS